MRADWSVVITQSGERGLGLVRRLEELGVRAVHWPLISTVVRSPMDIRRQCDRLPPDIDGVIVTSATAARVLANLYGSANWQWGRAVCYCIGDATASVLRERGIPCVVFPGVQDGSDMAQAMLAEWPRGGRTFLFVRGVRARQTVPEALLARGHAVFDLEVYDTLARPRREVEAIGAKGRLIFVLFSPSGVQAFAQSTRMIREHVLRGRHLVVAFGRTTLAALNEAQIPVAFTPNDVTHDGLVHTLLAFLREE
ncbi:uroporphyrinogen-III synthase [Alicyclobacillus fastidiosus]|uniref:Uroporphyrinogen-III synthase n=1 Tax=Alicyclobacillus fastidiosus TaxID=392011 RepID=A0ABV5AFY7_9BACL|nr:uroporphyrinogen-III synthase [Alicyclobacillus fastidiosus]WEH11659.1 uroporphyrinogen-III synthase [Alicyclobacillus fastidiosus]